MISMHIIDTDAFMDMPHSAQSLYMHMLMRADDDGFVGNHKKIIRMVGSQDDDIKILLAKRYVLPFESGVCVIKHWRIHNYIQKDRYNATKYTEEMALLKVKGNGAYTLDTECIQNGDTGKVRLGKVSLGKESNTVSKNSHGEFSNVQLTEGEYTNLCGSLGVEITDSLISELDDYLESTNKKYKSHYAALKSWARRKMQDHVSKQRTKVNQIAEI
jgi:hypothetical protein